VSNHLGQLSAAVHSLVIFQLGRLGGSIPPGHADAIHMQERLYQILDHMGSIEADAVSHGWDPQEVEGRLTRLTYICQVIVGAVERCDNSVNKMCAAAKQALGYVLELQDTSPQDSPVTAPAKSIGPSLTPSEQQIVDVICKVGHRLTTNGVLAQLEADGQPAAESTTKASLASLTRSKVLTNRRDTSPRGYGLPHW